MRLFFGWPDALEISSASLHPIDFKYHSVEFRFGNNRRHRLCLAQGL